MTEFNSSYIGLREDILKYVEGDKNIVLDVGCATGSNGEFLLNEGIALETFGIEYDSDMAKVAAKKNTKLFQGDLNDANFRKLILAESPMFDYILFADVLEHLINPEDILLELKGKLKKNGKIVISLPNVAHIETFIQLYVKKTWPKNKRGIFDGTHLRWFTKKDAFNLVEECGLSVDIYEPKFRARDAIGSKFNWKLNIIKAINKEWVTFQHILICQHAKK